jgi:hypothetical protein
MYFQDKKIETVLLKLEEIDQRLTIIENLNSTFNIELITYSAQCDGLCIFLALS